MDKHDKTLFQCVKTLRKLPDMKDALAFLTLIADGYSIARAGSVFKVKGGASTYVVTNATCSCPSFRLCKHIRAIRFAKALFKGE